MNRRAARNLQRARVTKGSDQNREPLEGNPSDFDKAMIRQFNRSIGQDRETNLELMIAREGGDPAKYAKQHGGMLPKLDRPPCAVPGCPNMTMVRGVCSKCYECLRHHRPGWEAVAKCILPSSTKKGQ